MTTTTPQENDRKGKLLTRHAASITESIASATVIKNDDLFFVCRSDGSVPSKERHGFGLYYHDCRYLKSYELRSAGLPLNALASHSMNGAMAVHELANPNIRLPDGTEVPEHSLAVKWTRVLDQRKLSLEDKIVVRNFGHESHPLPLSFYFDADFEDIFVVRGLTGEKRGKKRAPHWDGDSLVFAYDGADGFLRRAVVAFSVPVPKKEDRSAHFEFHLAPQETAAIEISVFIEERQEKNGNGYRGWERSDLGGLQKSVSEAGDRWIENRCRFKSDSAVLSRVLKRSLLDLHTLQTPLQGEKYFAAGVPWFVALFGRDSLVTSIETLGFDPAIAGDTLRLLAKYQGRKEDGWRDEEPGKILHELRVGELARLNAVPHTPYYGSIDSTLLFLMLMGHYVRWTGDFALFTELKSNVERALSWTANYGDRNGDGYIEYASRSKSGLINQGWKDSGDAIVDADGRIADPPISLAEVQGYLYAAKKEMALLYGRAGDAERARTLSGEADELKRRFNRDFWLEERGFYAMALQKGGQPVRSISSNPGHALWCGLIDDGRAATVVARLMKEDMNNGWGIRTLAENEKGYNPIGYHLGTVWPHDNAIIAAGFRRYGFVKEAGKIFSDLLQAAMDFEQARLPELFTGFSRRDYAVPVRYPIACHPQAWAAGAIPFLLQTSLGLEPDAFEKKLTIRNPTLPDFVPNIEIERLRVGEAEADLRFERHDGQITVRVLRTTGPLQVVVEPASARA